MKNIILLAALLCCITANAQTEEKFNKKFKMTHAGKVLPAEAFSFTTQTAGKHGFDKFKSELITAFVGQKLKVADSSRYTIALDYHYIYKVALYKMQYSNLRGQIIDNNDKSVVAVFEYNGNFDLDAISAYIVRRILN